MDRRRKKVLSHGPSYNRLHGAPPSQYSTSYNSANQSSRPRVQFNETLYQQSDDDRSASHGEHHSMNSKSQSLHPSASDPELARIMRVYGLDGSTIEGNVPTTSSVYRKPPEHSEHNQRLATFIVGLTNKLSNTVLVYPFIVLRRQCQVNHVGRKYHLTPFTLFGVALNLQRAQGFTCLWKGLGSSFIVSGITVCTEMATSEVSRGKLPDDVTTNSSLQSIANHLMLKSVSSLTVSPFYSAHLVESVQSEMVSETPGLFSCIIDGFSRLFGRNSTQRMLPFYQILLPNLSYALLRYILASVLQQLILYLMRQHTKYRHENNISQMDPRSLNSSGPSGYPSLPTPEAEQTKTLLNSHYPELVSGFFADLISDIALYPMETVLHRIHIQGTRTIIDNTDSGRGFLPVSSRYEGFFDCLSTTIATEGYSGLYRGFGALLLQYGVKYSVVRFTKFALKAASTS